MKENDILITQKLVSDEVSEKIIEVVIENMSDFDIENISIVSQNVNQNFEVIESNSTKKFTYSLNIPSANDLNADFGENADISDKLEIPPIAGTYSIGDGYFEVKSNELILVL